MVPPRNPMTGRPYQDFGKLQRPKAAAVLEIRNGAVFDCEMGGTVFNSTLMMRLERWYYKPPPRVKPPALRVHHLGSPIVSLCVPYGYSYQHIMLDMVPKLSMLKPFLEKHPEVQVWPTGLWDRGSAMLA